MISEGTVRCLLDCYEGNAASGDITSGLRNLFLTCPTKMLYAIQAEFLARIKSNSSDMGKPIRVLFGKSLNNINVSVNRYQLFLSQNSLPVGEEVADEPLLFTNPSTFPISVRFRLQA